jgi:flagellar basal-body rod modification protein FlgD
MNGAAMSAIDAVQMTPGAKTANAYSDLGSEEFMKIILTELSRQDPLKPNDTGALLEQLATLRSIQSDSDVQKGMKNLVGQNEFAAAAGLIGQGVSGISEDFQRVNGVVATVSRTDSGPVLTLGSGIRVPLGQVDTVVQLNNTREDGE